MNRITVEEVKAAYEKAGVKPKRCHFLLEGSACALGALALANGKSEEEILVWEKSFETTMQGLVPGYAEKYLEGLMFGFDNNRPDLVTPRASSNPVWQSGYEDGRAIAKAVFGE